MFYNLKIAIRNLRRNGLYSAINITGLTVSLATCILISLWVYDELSYDRFHANRENIHIFNTSINNESFFNIGPAALPVHAKVEIPEIKETCRINGYFSFSYLKYNDQQMLLDNNVNRGAVVDSSFFTMFTFPLLDGDARKPFTGDFSIILSETMAKALFGDENPMGKAIDAGWGEYFYVTGVMKDMPKNSSMRYDYLLPFSLQKRMYNPYPFEWSSPDEDFGNLNYNTYYELFPGTDAAQVEEKLINIMGRGLMPYMSLFGMVTPDMKCYLQPIAEQHLYNYDGTPGGLVKVRLFAIIAALVLVIACINYVNLVTARVGKRSKEMGIRHFIGAKWHNIVWQSLQETCIMLAIAIFLATCLIITSMPLFNQIAGKDMEFQFFSFRVLAIYGITFISVLALAGLYPSFFLASFRLPKLIKSKNTHTSLRKGLVVLQFVCSIALILSTLVITMQMNFIRKKDLGYDRENIICFAASGMKNNMDAVRNELRSNPDIAGTGTANFQNMLVYYFTYGVTWQDMEKATKFSQGEVDFDFLGLMNIQIVEGQLPPEASAKNYCLLNETAVREMQVREPLHQVVNFLGSNVTVSGIFKDFNFESLSQPIMPMILTCTKSFNDFVYVKTTAQGAKSALASIEKLWKEYCPQLLFSYSFLDENFERIYQADIRTGKLLYIFAFIAIMISCLGLFGLVTYTAETKTKEIGIRKVLGAKVSDIVIMLSKDFLILVGIAMLIAFPLAYYWLDKMLQDYAYRISIDWWMFAFAGIAIVILTLITVGWQAIKAATANPVDAIKSE